MQARRPLSFAVQCRHCINASCVDACITGALSIDTVSGAVIHDSQRCDGCHSSIMVCPVGAIQIAPNRASGVKRTVTNIVINIVKEDLKVNFVSSK